MSWGKRYLLEVSDFFSHGIQTSGNTIQYNLCNSFSGTTTAPSGSSYNYSGKTIVFTATTYNYSGITTTQLAALSYKDYENRVFYFLDYVNINTMNRRNELLDQALFYISASTTTTTTAPPITFSVTPSLFTAPTAGQTAFPCTVSSPNTWNLAFKAADAGIVDITSVKVNGISYPTSTLTSGYYVINGTFPIGASNTVTFNILPNSANTYGNFVYVKDTPTNFIYVTLITS